MEVDDGINHLHLVHCWYRILYSSPNKVIKGVGKVFRLISGWLVGIDGFNLSNRISDEVGRE